MRTKDISNFVLDKLRELTDETAVCHSSLITELLYSFPNLKSREYAANRINSILKNRYLVQQYTKIKGKDHKIYIVKEN